MTSWQLDNQERKIPLAWSRNNDRSIESTVQFLHEKNWHIFTSKTRIQTNATTNGIFLMPHDKFWNKQFNRLSSKQFLTQLNQTAINSLTHHRYLQGHSHSTTEEQARSPNESRPGTIESPICLSSVDC